MMSEDEPTYQVITQEEIADMNHQQAVQDEADRKLGALVRRMPVCSVLKHEFDGSWQYIDTAISEGEGPFFDTPDAALDAAKEGEPR